jgi:hypothetical protein
MMKANRFPIQFALTALAVLTSSGLASASSHREAPAISNDPAADNTDLWAWVSADKTSLNVVASYFPLEEPSGGPNYFKFSDDVLYEVHIARGPTSLEDQFTYQIEFHSNPIKRVDVADQTQPPGGGKEFFAQIAGYFDQTFTVTKIVKGQPPVVIAQNVDVAPPNIGPRTNAAWKAFGIYPKASGAGNPPDVYNDAFAASFIKNTGAEGMVWAGQRDDGFYVDLSRIFDLASIGGTALTPPLPNATDNIAGFNCQSIALEIPLTKLTQTGAAPTGGDNDTLGVWASASRRKVTILRGDGTNLSVGPWVQVSRLGLPLINEAVVGIQDKDKYNRTTPATDLTNIGAYILNPILPRDAAVVGILTPAQADAASGKDGPRTDIVDLINLKNIPQPGAHDIQTVGDVIRVDMGTTSVFPNGRFLPEVPGKNQETDVTDVMLSLLLLKQTSGVSDGVSKNDKNYLGEFPYLALPWQGATQGHGIIQ